MHVTQGKHLVKNPKHLYLALEYKHTHKRTQSSSPHPHLHLILPLDDDGKLALSFSLIITHLVTMQISRNYLNLPKSETLQNLKYFETLKGNTHWNISDFWMRDGY